jgi:alkanesulfonate monooxygenase SsuD/methylene tetrahydromethanopterin reductase-like flavin-dependent oxidoreductase (luciferase family)
MAMFAIRFDMRNPEIGGVSMAERYAAALDMAEWADRLGGLYWGLSEHHASADGYLPSPLPLAAAAAARTTKIRIAINAIPAPFHDPLRLAEDIAVVDQLSQGRLDIALVGGYVLDEFAMFGVEPSERPKRMTELVTTLKQAWSGEPFEYRGRTVRVTPTPFQPGGPKLTLGGSSEGAARRAEAGRRIHAVRAPLLGALPRRMPPARQARPGPRLRRRHACGLRGCRR